ncbi:MAG: hypothetical protein WA361_06005 [Candidatus Acidiferrales bacterium]
MTTEVTPSLLVKLLRKLKRSPSLVSVKRAIWGSYFNFRQKYFDFNRLNICRTFPLFTPHSGGKYKDRARLTIQSVNQTIPLLSSFAMAVRQKPNNITRIRDFPVSDQDLEAAREIKRCFDKYGSDKASNDYHNVYGPLLKNRDEITGILEIGMGTNNTDVVSNMGLWGYPGASLKAFRDFLKSATVYGADIDKRILFEDERIKTFFVDQTDSATFAELGKSIPSDLDLVIDDGLHSPNANLETLKFGLTKIRIGAWVVVEDIAPDALPLWEVVSVLLPSNYKPFIIRAESAFLFAVKRLN